ncbi:MAG: hypothetical protein HYX96_08130 [Chloroflexi bacterium]|nr:hypothetical protein [Chloroflexota bacterium]
MGADVLSPPLAGTAVAIRLKRHVLVGFAAGCLLLGFYFGLLTLSQGLAHALEQSRSLWYWILPLAAGFGFQAGLFSFIRSGLRHRRAAMASVAASGGISAGSMAACCAHHLTDLLPFLGIVGLTAFAAQYQTAFFTAGLVSSLIGSLVMLETIQRLGLCPRLASWRWNIARLRKAATVLGVFTLAAVILGSLLGGGV